ncbi:TrbC/VirB2 family protein [Litoreibacter roseus]|uniref:Type IV secretion system protein VirB2 n=1 Tax=Litoreibacter roseus TaxID=2601869 RepID=A0A6N6JP25_9RHOB|nr:TrbC/VirB2 family protein [Litoreibacter roseus]GFE67278.1 hypothetical protein KIN_43520 [Litoreibacter roseus]
MQRHRQGRFSATTRLIVIAGWAGLFAVPGAAQDLSPIQNMLETVEASLTGPIGVAVSTLAVICTGFLCMMGRLNWGWFASVVIGIVLIFSADTIVGGFT